MSDTSINQIIQYGTNADMMAYTPAPPSGVQTLYLWEDTDNPGDLYMWDGSAWVLVGTGSGAGITELTGNVTAGPGSGSQVATIPAATVTEAMQVLADNTTQNVSTTKHGYAPKAPNDATKYLDGTGAYTVPAGTGTVTTTGSPASGNLTKFSGAASITNGDLTGAVTTSGTLVTTLAGGALVDDGNSGTTKTIDWLSLLIGRHKLTLTGNVTLTLSNPVSGGIYTLYIFTGAGSFTVTWPGNVKWDANGAPTITVAASKMDIIVLGYDGTNFYGSFNQGYTP